jgi:hypothetical protein
LPNTTRAMSSTSPMKSAARKPTAAVLRAFIVHLTFIDVFLTRSPRGIRPPSGHVPLQGDDQMTLAEMPV